MTTGEKIAKLRKENGYTQEEFGDLLGVTRQSVSKWESDMSFPETDKLILIARHFNCSLDYLLNNEYKDESNNQRIKKEKILKGNIVDAIALMTFSTIQLICYFLPFAQLRTDLLGSGWWHDDFYISVNFYNFVFSSSYEIGNILFLIHFLLTILVLSSGVLLLFFKDNRLYKANYISSIVLFISIILIFIIVAASSNISAGLILITLLNVSYFFLILSYRKKKKKHEKNI